MRAKIHTLVFLGFTALLPLVAGCIVDNNNSQSCDNRILISWSIDDNLGSSISCEGAGADTVRVISAGVISDFPCGAYAGTTFQVPGGTYPVDVQLLTRSGALLSEANATWSIPACGGRDLGNVAFCIGSAC